MTFPNKRINFILLAIPGLLLIPLIAMQFSEAVNWSVFDFLVMGLLLLGLSLAVEFVLRKTPSRSTRLLLVASVILLFLLVWVELAVGVFGTPLAGS